MRLLDDDTMEIVFTMTDPKAFKAPWVITRQYKDYDIPLVFGLGGRVADDPKSIGTHPDYKGAELVTMEIICNENNRNPVDEDGALTLKLGDDE